MNHTDNIISDTIDQIQHSDQQPAPAAREDITALFAQLNPQDVEHFYQSYRRWNIQPRIQTLHMEITALQQAIARNAELMDQYHPSPGAQAILTQFQTNGVNDLDLLDRMLERGDDWLDHTMQLLEQCERLDIIHGNYTEWCEHALEGAYDWIGSMSEDDDTSVESTESASLSSEVFDESTEQLLLQKLLSEEEEATQIPDLVEQPVSDISSEKQAVDIISTELPANVEALPEEAAHPVMSQAVQEEEADEEKQTVGASSTTTINDATNISSAEELILLPAHETDLSEDEENAADLVAVQGDTSDDVEALDIEDEVNETIQQEPPAAEVTASLVINESPDTKTSEAAEITNTTNDLLDTETSEVAEITDAANDPLDTETSEVTDLTNSVEMPTIEIEPDQPDIAKPTEEPIAHTLATPQDIASSQEEHLVEKTEPTSSKPAPEPSNANSTLEQSNEITTANELQNVLAEVSSIAEPVASDEEQQPTETSSNAEEVMEPISSSATLTTDVEPVIEQAETIQETTTAKTTTTPESEDEMLIQELSSEEDGEQTTKEESPEQQQTEDHNKAVTDDKEAIEQPESEIPTITPETTISSNEGLVYSRGDGSASPVNITEESAGEPSPVNITEESVGEPSPANITEEPASETLPVNISEEPVDKPSLVNITKKPASEPSALPPILYSSHISGSDEDTVAIPKITFSTNRTTPPRIPAVAKTDMQPIIPESIADQTPSPRENTTLTESATIPNLPAVIMQTPQPQLPAPLQTPQPQSLAPAPLKEPAEAPTIMAHQHQTNASYTEPASRHYPTPIWQEYQNQPSIQPAPEILPQPRPGFFRRLWLWFLAWLKG